MRAGSRRRRIVDYIADQGGELRSESGQGLRRQICDALGERPTPVSEALIALEKSGLLEREIDVERRRCHAIRLVSRPAPAPVITEDTGRSAIVESNTVNQVAAETGRLRAELDEAERNLSEAIHRAADASRRVQRLRLTLMRAGEQRPERDVASGSA